MRVTTVMSGSPGAAPATVDAVADSSSLESAGVAASAAGGEEYPLAMKMNSTDVCGVKRFGASVQPHVTRGGLVQFSAGIRDFQ